MPSSNILLIKHFYDHAVMRGPVVFFDCNMNDAYLLQSQFVESCIVDREKKIVIWRDYDTNTFSAPQLLHDHLMSRYFVKCLIHTLGGGMFVIILNNERFDITIDAHTHIWFKNHQYTFPAIPVDEYNVYVLCYIIARDRYTTVARRHTPHERINTVLDYIL